MYVCMYARTHARTCVSMYATLLKHLPTCRYCDPRYVFPAQEQVIGFAVDKCLNALHSSPSTLIVCGTYTIGKEKVFRGTKYCMLKFLFSVFSFAAIADVLGVKICVSKEKKAVLDCLECTSLSDSLTTDYSKSCLHILPMAKLNLKVSEDAIVMVECWLNWHT